MQWVTRPVLTRLRRGREVMRLLILILFGLLMAILLGTVLSRDTGMMILSYGGYNIQTSLSFFILASLLAFITVYFVVRVLGGFVRLPRSLDRWSARRRHRRSEKHLCQGLLAFLEGDFKTAEQAFQKGAKYSRLPLVNYLAAARAAQHIGAIGRRDHYLRLAHNNSPDAGLAVGLTQAKLQLTQQQTEEAYATLKHLATDKNACDQVNVLLLEAATELREWPEALRLLNDPRSRKILPAEQLRARLLSVYAGLLRQAAASGDRDLLESEWQQVPPKLREELSLLETYVSMRLQFPDSADCEPLLRKSLKKHWHASLLRLYGLVAGSDGVKQLQFAERLLSSHAGDAVLLLTLGRLCRKNSLWGKAKAYLQESIAAQASTEAYQELALLLEQEGEHVAAGTCFRKGLALATGLSSELESAPALLVQQQPGKDAI